VDLASYFPLSISGTSVCDNKNVDFFLSKQKGAQIGNTADRTGEKNETVVVLWLYLFGIGGWIHRPAWADVLCAHHPGWL